MIMQLRFVELYFFTIPCVLLVWGIVARFMKNENKEKKKKKKKGLLVTRDIFYSYTYWGVWLHH
jgi:hypothetical protein